MEFFGPFSFGLVTGWVCYRTLRRKSDGAALGDIASVVGAVGGATVVALFKNAAFDSYCVGLAAGFFAYFIVGIIVARMAPQTAGSSPGEWMNSRDSQ